MDDEQEFPETVVTVIEPMHKITVSELPQSPKKAFNAALALGWEAVAWLSIVSVPPTLYMAASKDETKSVGDVLYDGYTGKLYVIEARDPETRAIGFRAHYVGKQYEDDRKAPAGSFDYAFIADPVGVPRRLEFFYKPIPPMRFKYEDDKSLNRRRAEAQRMADEQNRLYNDGSYHFNQQPMFNVSGEFDAWLSEWRSFVPNDPKKEITNV